MHPFSRRLLALAVAGVACSEPVRDVFSVDGLVQGTVRDSGGDPVEAAWVALEGSYPLNSGSSEALYDSVQTDASGHYVGHVGVLNLPDTTATLAIRVWPPAGAGLNPAVRSDLEVRLTADLPPADTLLVDFTLQPN